MRETSRSMALPESETMVFFQLRMMADLCIMLPHNHSSGRVRATGHIARASESNNLVPALSSIPAYRGMPILGRVRVTMTSGGTFECTGGGTTGTVLQGGIEWKTS